MPKLQSAGSRGERLAIIPGQPPVPGRMPSGCRFHPRCPQRFEPCDSKDPPAFDLGGGRRVACWLEQGAGT